jgi:hypothetical protein
MSARIFGVLGVEGEADARRDPDLMAVDRDRRRYAVQHLARNQPGVLALGEVLDDERVLVAPQPRHGVGLAQPLDQTAGADLEQAVAGDVAELVVDRLKAVEVEDHDRDHPALPAGPGERPLEPIVEEGAVGEPGQLVVLGETAEAFGLAALPDGIADRALEQRGVDPALVEEVRGAERHGLEVELEGRTPAQDDHRHPMLPALGDADDLQALAVRQGRLEQQDVELPLPQEGEPAREVGCPLQGEAGVRDRIEDLTRAAIVAIVGLDQQHAHGIGTRRRDATYDHTGTRRRARTAFAAACKADVRGRGIGGGALSDTVDRTCCCITKKPWQLQNHCAIGGVLQLPPGERARPQKAWRRPS